MQQSKLKVLLRFTMTKRICNKTFVILNIVVMCLLFGVVFSDFVIKWFDASFFESQTIYLMELPELSEYAKHHLPNMSIHGETQDELLESYLAQGAWVIRKVEDYQVLSNQDFSPMSWIQLQQTILEFDRMMLEKKLSPEEFANRQMPGVIPVLMREEKESTMNQTWAFLLITSIYFVALSYVGIAASDVVYEKSTRMMELILTSVSSTTHLIAKLMSGWFVLIFQVLMMMLGGMIALGCRYVYDKGKGLLAVLIQLELLPGNFDLDLGELFNLMTSQKHLFLKLLIGLSFMLIGILFVQTILVILSSFIGSIEESGTIQSPFYLLFMGVYYLTIFLNTPTHMNQGIGKTLSMLPFFSMLFMPCRMFYYHVVWSEISISFIISLVSLGFLWMVGAPIYQMGVLDYSSQSVASKVKSSFVQLFFQKR